MSDSLSVTVADAVAATLTAGEFAQPVIAHRTWLPRYEPQQLAATQVAVVPSGEKITQSTRTRNAHEVTVDVSVMQRIETDTAADALSLLVEQLADHLRLQRLTGFPPAVWSGTELYVTHSLQHLQEHNVFLSVFRVTYRVVR